MTPARAGNRLAGRLVLLGVLAAPGTGGCEPFRAADLEPQLQQARQENARLKADIRQLQQTLAERRKEIQTLRALGEKRLDLLFHVRRIRLGRYTAGRDLDNTPGDDGVRVYLSPLDQHGQPIKAAGTVRIRLFDLARPDGNLLAEHAFSVEEVGRHWQGWPLTYHYAFDCPWTRPPAGGEVTVRAEFTDYLTGKHFTAQRACKVTPPATTMPATTMPAK